MSVTTKLVDKHYSPLIVKRFETDTLTCIIGLITDADVDDVQVSATVIEELNSIQGKITDQSLRNLAGAISNKLAAVIDSRKPGLVEGVGVIIRYRDVVVSSLYGDMMNHAMCRDEFYRLALRDEKKDCFHFILRKYNVVRGWPLWIVTDGQPLDDTLIVRLVRQNEPYDNYEAMNTLLEAIWLTLSEHHDKIAVFLYVDKTWFTLVCGFDSEDLQVILSLLKISPHV